MSNNLPFHTEQHDEIIRHRLAHDKSREIEMSSAANALRDIALVGAHIKDGELYNGDYERLFWTLARLVKLGVPLHPQSRFWAYNLEPPLSSDFLAAALGETPDAEPALTHKTDLLLTCLVMDGNHDTSPSHISVDTSPLQIGDAWDRAAKAAEVKIVATYGQRSLAIKTSDFDHSGTFIPIIRTAEEEIIHTQAYHYGGDFRGHIGILVHKDYQDMITKPPTPG